MTYSEYITQILCIYYFYSSCKVNGAPKAVNFSLKNIEDSSAYYQLPMLPSTGANKHILKMKVEALYYTTLHKP